MSAPHAPLLLPVVDAVGTFAFALSGGTLGVQKRFDIVGVLFLSCVAAVAGGVTRDLLIGDDPPAALRHWHILAIAMAGGLVAFFLYPVVRSLSRPVLVLDAVGLALFAVTGTQKALDFGIQPVQAAVLGMISGIGGGMLRDVLAGDVPFVLRVDLYAVAALAAGAMVASAEVLGLDAAIAMFAGAAACLFLRMMAIFRGWHAPVSRWSGDKGE